jgi:hypothetical protein
MFASGPGSHSAFRTSQLPESAANQLKGCRSNQMHRETKPASAVRLFTSQFNSTKCAAADILRALCTRRRPHILWRCGSHRASLLRAGGAACRLGPPLNRPEMQCGCLIAREQASSQRSAQLPAVSPARSGGLQSCGSQTFVPLVCPADCSRSR